MKPMGWGVLVGSAMLLGWGAAALAQTGTPPAPTAEAPRTPAAPATSTLPNPSTPDAACLECHTGGNLEPATIRGKKVPLDIQPAVLKSSAHKTVPCVGCHVGYNPDDTPHTADSRPVQCGVCHAEIASLHAKSLHGQAIARGDPLAPRCIDCHGTHDILPRSDPRSPVYPLHVPFTCGKCHQEGAPVQRQRVIHQAHILENFSESIHGEALLQKGLVVAPSCASCHTAHSILPHTDPASSIARRNIAATCTKCHAGIEAVHRKIIRGELWEKETNVLPACVDCHQPHKIRKVFYDQGMADLDCMRCHEDPKIRASADGRSLTVRSADLASSRHAKVSCSQCHSGVSASRRRPCETITQKVDCSSCHAEIGRVYQTSMHGQLIAKTDPNGPTCKECHGTHQIFGKADPVSMTFPTNVPQLCAKCHREGEKAAKRYKGNQHDIVKHYIESIHGKGLLQSGLTVTATCTSCHTAHGVLPKDDPVSSVNRNNIPSTCGRCHHGIEEQFERSIHSPAVARTDKKLPVCIDCHTAHTITRTDNVGFKLAILDQCGRCHEKIAKTYFDTYHGKVSQLGYAKTAKCFDCHGSHDILPPSDPRSHLSRQHVVETCRKCHAGATRQFAGYLTHATHHDPKKYPLLFWTFWGMTSLLIGTFTIGGIHTLLWLPRAIAMRRARGGRNGKGEAEDAVSEHPAGEGSVGDGSGAKEEHDGSS